MGKFLVLNSDEIPWEDGEATLGIPTGVRMKILNYNEELDQRDCLVTFPDGYVEPRHEHECIHSDYIIKGKVLVDGKELGPGDFIYGPSNIVHGPFKFLGGVVLAASIVGDPIHKCVK